MQRRTFLGLCGASAVGWLWAGDTRLCPFVRLSGEPCFPGARLQVAVADHAPAGSQLEVQVRHADHWHPSTPVPATPGQQLSVPTPYPHDDLVAGDYTVDLVLRDRRGRELERLTAGSYRVRQMRFSA